MQNLRKRKNGAKLQFTQADFCALSEAFTDRFDIIIHMDNALLHMLSGTALETAVRSIVNQIGHGSVFIASIRDYDLLLTEKSTYSPPYIHKTDKGQRITFQTWEWDGNHYKFIQCIIDDEGAPQTSRFACEYRATRREELTILLLSNSCSEGIWKLPEETGFVLS